MTDIYELIQLLEKRIKELPAGYISKKNIHGKPRYYLQWRENGKMRSKYIRDDQLTNVQEQIEERKRLQIRLKEKSTMVKNIGKNQRYETNITVGNNLSQMVSKVKGLKKRDAFAAIKKYLYANDYTRVCAVYGLRRTGKTTMLFQANEDMSDEDFQKSAYI